MPKDSGIGASTKRREDVRFLSGKGVYTDDLNLRGQTYAVMVRSSVAHGKIVSIDTTAAEGMPGVVAVFTGEDFKDVGGNPAGLKPSHASLAYSGISSSRAPAETASRARVSTCPSQSSNPLTARPRFTARSARRKVSVKACPPLAASNPSPVPFANLRHRGPAPFGEMASRSHVVGD